MGKGEGPDTDRFPIQIMVLCWQPRKTVPAEAAASGNFYYLLNNCNILNFLKITIQFKNRQKTERNKQKKY